MVHHGTSIPFTDDKRWILWHIWTLLILLYDNPAHVIVLSSAYKELAYLDVILTCCGELPGQTITWSTDVLWARICQHFVGDFHWNSGSGLLCAGRRWSSLTWDDWPNWPSGPACSDELVLPSLCSADIQCWFCEGLKPQGTHKPL